MTEWAPKRFYKTAEVAAEDGGFAVRLDGRPVRTPGKRVLVLPTEAMAAAVATEWNAQEGVIDPRAMPWTRSANTALDKVAVQQSEVMDHLIEYAGTDLLCYRAEGPDGLTDLQSAEWDPILEWIEKRFAVRLKLAEGVMPVAQDPSAMDTLRNVMTPMSAFQLTGFYDLVSLSGSYGLALAAVEEFRPADAVWRASRVDEDWQAEQWGSDEEAEEAAEIKKAAFLHAFAFFRAA